MAKIIPFPKPQDGLVALLEELTNEAREGKIEKLAMAMTSPSDSTIATAYHNVDVVDMQYLASHIQVDAMNEIVRVNYFDKDEE